MYFSSLISKVTVSYKPISSLIFRFLMQILSLLVLNSWHTYAYSHPSRGSKSTHNLLKNGGTLTKTVLLKLNFQDGSHLGANFFIFILNFYRECLLFHLRSRGISLHNAILTRIQNGSINRGENSHIFLKNVVFEAYFLTWRSFMQ